MIKNTFEVHRLPCREVESDYGFDLPRPGLDAVVKLRLFYTSALPDLLARTVASGCSRSS